MQGRADAAEHFHLGISPVFHRLVFSPHNYKYKTVSQYNLDVKLGKAEEKWPVPTLKQPAQDQSVGDHGWSRVSRPAPDDDDEDDDDDDDDDNDDDGD